MGSGTRFSVKFPGEHYMVFWHILWRVPLNWAHLGMV